MRRWASILLILIGFGVFASPARALDPTSAVENGTSPGDWLGQTIKDNADNWDIPGRGPGGIPPYVPDIGMSAGMYEILRQVLQQTGDETYRDPCKAAAWNKAWSALYDAWSAGSALQVGKALGNVILDIAGKAEASGISELIEKARNAVDKTQKLKDLYDRFFGKAKPEVFIHRAVWGKCKISVLAIWDKKAATYEIIVYGDCDCSTERGFLSEHTVSLKTFFVRFTGKVRLQLDSSGNQLTLQIYDAGKPEVKANCNCGNGATVQPTRPVTEGPTTVTPPPLPPRGKTTCPECKPIVDRIDQVYADLDALDRDIRSAKGEYDGAVNAGDSKAAAAAKAEVDRLGLRELALKRELQDLAAQLAACEQTRCRTGKIIELTPRPPATSPPPPSETPPATPPAETPPPNGTTPTPPPPKDCRPPKTDQTLKRMEYRIDRYDRTIDQTMDQVDELEPADQSAQENMDAARRRHGTKSTVYRKAYQAWRQIDAPYRAAVQKLADLRATVASLRADHDQLAAIPLCRETPGLSPLPNLLLIPGLHLGRHPHRDTDRPDTGRTDQPSRTSPRSPSKPSTTDQPTPEDE